MLVKLQRATMWVSGILALSLLALIVLGEMTIPVSAPLVSSMQETANLSANKPAAPVPHTQPDSTPRVRPLFPHLFRFFHPSENGQ
jgi:hypothetical protein